MARQLIQQNVLDLCRIVSLSGEDYGAIVGHLSEARIVGGVTYDALILYAALKVDVDSIVTLNVGDLSRIYPRLAEKVTAP